METAETRLLTKVASDTADSIRSVRAVHPSGYICYELKDDLNLLCDSEDAVTAVSVLYMFLVLTRSQTSNIIDALILRKGREEAFMKILLPHLNNNGI
jgi:hypothetical protein